MARLLEGRIGFVNSFLSLGVSVHLPIPSAPLDLGHDRDEPSHHDKPSQDELDPKKSPTRQAASTSSTRIKNQATSPEAIETTSPPAMATTPSESSVIATQSSPGSRTDPLRPQSPSKQSETPRSSSETIAILPSYAPPVDMFMLSSSGSTTFAPVDDGSTNTRTTSSTTDISSGFQVPETTKQPTQSPKPTATASELPSATPIPKSNSVSALTIVLVVLAVVAVLLGLGAVLLCFVRRRLYRPGTRGCYNFNASWLGSWMNIRQNEEKHSQYHPASFTSSARVSADSASPEDEHETNKNTSFVDVGLDKSARHSVSSSWRVSGLTSAERESPDSDDSLISRAAPSPLISEKQESSEDMEIYNQRNGLGIYSIGLAQTTESGLRAENFPVARIALAPARSKSFSRTADVCRAI